jgi:hypothetical protein
VLNRELRIPYVGSFKDTATDRNDERKERQFKIQGQAVGSGLNSSTHLAVSAHDIVRRKSYLPGNYVLFLRHILLQGGIRLLKCMIGKDQTRCHSRLVPSSRLSKI